MSLTPVNPTSMRQNPAFAQGVDVTAADTASQEVWGRHETAISVLFAAALGRPECLAEIEALAQVPAR